MEKYQIEFNKFLKEGQTPDVTHARLAEMYAEYNLKMVAALGEFRTVRQECADRKDENDKPLSAVKADVLADSSKQAEDYEIARAHVNNIDHYIDVLKPIK